MKGISLCLTRRLNNYAKELYFCLDGATRCGRQTKMLLDMLPCLPFTSLRSMLSAVSSVRGNRQNPAHCSFVSFAVQLHSCVLSGVGFSPLPAPPSLFFIQWLVRPYSFFSQWLVSTTQTFPDCVVWNCATHTPSMFVLLLHALPRRLMALAPCCFHGCYT